MVMRHEKFYLTFSENYFDKGDIITYDEHVTLKVINTPHKKWWRKLFQFITFGIYKVPTQYKCKIINKI